MAIFYFITSLGFEKNSDLWLVLVHFASKHSKLLNGLEITFLVLIPSEIDFSTIPIRKVNVN